MNVPMADVAPPQAIPLVPAAVTRAARLRREGRSADAIALVESALDEARSTPFDVPFRDRMLLALTLADLYVVAEHSCRARDLLKSELPFAESILELIRCDGTPAQIHAAATGVRQLRDRASQLALLGQPAPEIGAVEWVRGSPVTLAALHGRVVLIEFWAPRCHSCAAMFGFLNALHSRYADRGLTILGLTSFRSGNGDRTVGRDLIHRTAVEHEVRFPVAVAADHRLAQAYGANGIPTFVVIDQEGSVRLATSKPDKPALESEISRLLDTDTLPAP